MTKPIKFGTDGWRAIIADQFTFDNVRACAQGIADYLISANLKESTIVIGNDTRFASDDFATACAEVLAGNGIKVLLCNRPAPTPVVSFSVAHTKSAGGIVITASHNPGIYNGIKYKDSIGASAPTEIVDQIEKLTNEALSSGKIQRLDIEECYKKGIVRNYDPIPDYSVQVQKLIDIEPLKNTDMKIVVDSMFGAGSGYFQHFLSGDHVHFVQLHGERNPLFPGLRPEPIARNLGELSRVVKETGAHVGLATDGDSDRIGIITETGEFVNQLQVFSLLALYFLEIRGERRPIIRSLCSSNMLDKLGKMYNVPVFVTKVGFKYVAPLMLEKDAFIGGEESGGYGFRGHVPERDAILAGLFFIDYMVRTKKSPAQLIQHLFDKVGPHYYDRNDYEIPAGQSQNVRNKLAEIKVDSIAGVKVANLDKTDGYKFNLEDESWLLLRLSGTEPLIRVYAESNTPERVQEMLEAGKKLVGE